MGTKWSHASCERCWFDGPLGMLPNGDARMPVRAKREPTICCFCGGITILGIHVRKDPLAEELRCAGDHEDTASWSRVASGPPRDTHD